MLHLVVGTTGPLGLGRAICKALIEQGKRVRALVRPTSNPDIVAELQALGVELARGDLRDRASLGNACQGVSAVLASATTVPSAQPGDSIETVDRDGYINLIDAAKAAGVQHFVYTSYSRTIQEHAPCPLTEAKRAVESKLAQSGLTYTILRPSYLLEYWVSPDILFDFANATVTVPGTGNKLVSWVSALDVANFAVASLTNDNARNQALEIGGPQPLSQLEIARLCEQVSGREYTIKKETAAELEQKYSATDEPKSKSMWALKMALAQGNPVDMSTTLQQFSEIKLTPVRVYLEKTLSAGLSPAETPAPAEATEATATEATATATPAAAPQAPAEPAAEPTAGPSSEPTPAQ